MNSNLNIAIWNANGFTSHIHEIKTFLVAHEIDIMLVSETHFTNKSFAKISRYNIYATNHPAGTARGGTAIIVKSNIKHNVLNKFEADYLQATSIVIQDHKGPLTVTSVYCPPRHSIKKQDYIQFFSTLGNRFLAGGDYNAKHPSWGSRTTNPKGLSLYRAIQSEHYRHASTGEPTFWPADLNKLPDLIDFIVLKGIDSNNLVLKSSLDLSSDHSPILARLSSDFLHVQKPAILHSIQTHWPSFRSIIDETLHLDPPLKNRLDIETALEFFNNAVQHASWSCTPASSNLNGKKRVSSSIMQLIKEKRKLRKIFKETRHPRDKQKFNAAARILKNTLREKNNREFSKHLSGLSANKNTDYSLWKALKNFDHSTTRVPPLRSNSNGWLKTDKEKAKAFAKHLTSVFTPHPSTSQVDETDIFEYLDAPHQMSLPIVPTTISEIKKIIMVIKANKAPGYDLVTGKVLKELPYAGLKYITQLFNAILRTSYVPKQFKIAEIILISKPGKPLEAVTSYRPISLLPILSKVFEKILLGRLKPILIENKLIPDHQFGFRQEHATTEQVHRVYNTIRKALEEEKFCTAAFLDVSQAFDKVWHPGLLYKLKKALPHSYYEVLRSYLNERYFRIKLGDEITDLAPISAGVPQGSVLGPVLYTIFTADLPLSKLVETATYADDTVIMSTSRNSILATYFLQENIINIQKWLNRWRIQVNPTKSTQVTFTLKRETCAAVTLFDQQLPQADNVKYLGMHLDRRLTWQKHIMTKRKQLGLKLTSLQWLMGRSSVLSLKNKLLLYKAVIKPIWTYGIQLWGAATKTNIDIIERFQAKTLRLITGDSIYSSNELIRNKTMIPSIREEIKRFSDKYSSRLSSHPNALARAIIQPNTYISRLKRGTPLQII